MQLGQFNASPRATEHSIHSKSTIPRHKVSGSRNQKAGNGIGGGGGGFPLGDPGGDALAFPSGDDLVGDCVAACASFRWITGMGGGVVTALSSIGF